MVQSSFSTFIIPAGSVAHWTALYSLQRSIDFSQCYHELIVSLLSLLSNRPMRSHYYGNVRPALRHNNFIILNCDRSEGLIRIADDDDDDDDDDDACCSPLSAALYCHNLSPYISLHSTLTVSECLKQRRDFNNLYILSRAYYSEKFRFRESL